MSDRLELRNPYAPTQARGSSFRPLVDRRGSKGGLALKSAGDGGWDALCAAIDGGIGVLLATTSDGGALSLTVYVGDQRYRTYCANADELADAWTALQALADQHQGSAAIQTQKTRRNAS